MKLVKKPFSYTQTSKCEFHKERIDYLGYCISHEEVEIDPKKV